MKNRHAASMGLSKPRRPAHRAAPALEWLSDLSGRTARITSIGSRALLIENHSGILEFSPEHIVLASRCGAIEIHGADLTLSEVRKNALIVRGSVQQLALPCTKENEDEP